MSEFAAIDLRGIRVLNPRPQPQAAKLSRMIHQAGGIAIEFPTLEIHPLATDWIQQLPDLFSLQFALFVSANAVLHFFRGLQQHHLNWPAHIRIFAIGKGTACALKKEGIYTMVTPAFADSEHMLAVTELQNIHGQKGMLISGERSRPLLATTLTQRGANMCQLAVYRRSLPKKNLPLSHALWQDDAVDIILMMSQEGMENLFVLFEEEARAWLQSKPWIVISPRLVAIARQLQIKHVISSSYTELLTTLMELTHDYGRNPH